MKTQLTKHYCTITGELGIIVAVKGDQQNGTQPFYDRGADSGHRTHTPKHQILNLACLPFHHIRINCANRGRTCDGGVKVLCLTAWRWRIIYPAYYVTLLRFQRAGNNVNEKFYMPFRAGLSDKTRTCGFLLPKQAQYQLRYAQRYTANETRTRTPFPERDFKSLVPANYTIAAYIEDQKQPTFVLRSSLLAT